MADVKKIHDNSSSSPPKLAGETRTLNSVLNRKLTVRPSNMLGLEDKPFFLKWSLKKWSYFTPINGRK